MHELSLCRSIFTIADRAREGRPVEIIHLQVGQLRQVVPRTLEYCWGLVTEQTELHGSRLDIDHIEVRLRCEACSATMPVADSLVLACSACGSGDVTVTQGEEFMLTSIDLGGRGDGQVPPARGRHGARSRS
ncbi:MAG: hydrogenase maturation nickel metallochaperone HypA [Solirubrobacteraceae bacterium]|nr:hydrogenase maturation nickel metallochaperone HypA [Solirubrobacteraceae bacterium]